MLWPVAFLLSRAEKGGMPNDAHLARRCVWELCKALTALWVDLRFTQFVLYRPEKVANLFVTVPAELIRKNNNRDVQLRFYQRLVS